VCAKKEDDAGPDGATLLGVDNRWMNAYRSADYVGRQLWEGPGTQGHEYEPTESPTPAERGDACIGPGAHTHYWDESADWVARRLGARINEIIAELRGGVRKASDMKTSIDRGSEHPADLT
jgi:hypothetical protein